MLGEVIREHREILDLSRDELASRIGVSSSTVGMWEGEEAKPDEKSMADIASAFGMSVEELVNERDQMILPFAPVAGIPIMPMPMMPDATNGYPIAALAYLGVMSANEHQPLDTNHAEDVKGTD